jgi:HSP20 family protein
MNDPHRFHLERLEQRLGALVSTFTQVHRVTYRPSASWIPSVNAYRCADAFVICVELAGIERRLISIRAERRRLDIRGQRPPPEPDCREPRAVQALAMEIDYGPFERVIDLPADIDPDRVTAEHRNGLLWVHLPLSSPA